MTDLQEIPTTVPDLPGGPYDIEFFFDPGCPFAWQTSVWLRRVAELRDLSIGWRFISLHFINEDKDRPERARQAHERGRRYHRICAAARERFGNDVVADLYRTYGERYWYTEAEGDPAERAVAAVANVDPGDILEALGLPSDLLDAGDDDRFDDVLRAESAEAFRRTGPDVGTPILSWPGGGSYFGPVISLVPDDEQSLALYDAVEVLTRVPGFSELKRSARTALDLPLLRR